MKPGQWVGFIESCREGGTASKVVLDADNAGDSGLSGHLTIFFGATRLGAAVELLHLDYDQFHSDDLMVDYFYVQSGSEVKIEDAQKFMEDIQLPEFFNLTMRMINSDRCEFLAVDNNAQEFMFTLLRTDLPDRSNLVGREISWTDFKSEVTGFQPERFVFRGQSKLYPLRSTFHRTERRCLHKYLSQDIPRLHRATSAFTKHVFRLEQPEEKGALVALAQHHGFPTPLIDWTYSPYIAAWFAFENDDERPHSSDRNVRILVLDRDALKEFQESSLLTWTSQHISSLETLAIDNSRLAPQQGLLTLTNVEDVESHLAIMGEVANKSLLRAFDIPYFERKKALNDLRLMGITRRTLFPGLDVICSDLKGRFF